jgi:hypothetical protein
MTEQFELDVPLFGIAVDLTPFAVIGAAALSLESGNSDAQAPAITSFHPGTAIDPVVLAASGRRGNDGARALVVEHTQGRVVWRLVAIGAAAAALAVLAAKHTDTYQQESVPVAKKPAARAQPMELPPSVRPPNPTLVVAGPIEGAHSTNPKQPSEPLATTLERLGGGLR